MFGSKAKKARAAAVSALVKRGKYDVAWKDRKAQADTAKAQMLQDALARQGQTLNSMMAQNQGLQQSQDYKQYMLQQLASQQMHSTYTSTGTAASGLGGSSWTNLVTASVSASSATTNQTAMQWYVDDYYQRRMPRTLRLSDLARHIAIRQPFPRLAYAPDEDDMISALDMTMRSVDALEVKDGAQFNLALPDGTVIFIKPDGSFQIEDADAKVIYRANRVRNFNTFLNASDRMEEFIAFCAQAGVKQDEMLKLPLKLFVQWLALEAAKADNEPAPPVALLPDLRRRAKPRCTCGRFLSRRHVAAGLSHCRPVCFEGALTRIAA